MFKYICVLQTMEIQKSQDVKEICELCYIL